MTPEREREIRAMLALATTNAIGEPWRSATAELISELDDAARTKVELRAEVDRLREALDDAEAVIDIERAALTAHAVESERERDKAIARAERAEAQLAALREPAAAARSAFAEVRAPDHAGDEESGEHDEDCEACAVEAARAALDALDTALADTTAAVEAYTHHVRAEALREAAGTCSSRASEHEADIALALGDESWVTADRLRFRSLEASEIASELRALANKIERGER
ncbi:MAG: hypothetical protein ACRCSL_16680 [Microbacterium sp.]